MVKRIQCRVVHSVSLTSRSSCADPAEPSAGDPTCPEPVERDIERILKSIYNIQSKISNRNAPPGRPVLSVIEGNRPTPSSIQNPESSIQNPASLGLIVDFVA